MSCFSNYKKKLWTWSNSISIWVLALILIQFFFAGIWRHSFEKQPCVEGCARCNELLICNHLYGGNASQNPRNGFRRLFFQLVELLGQFYCCGELLQTIHFTRFMVSIPCYFSTVLSVLIAVCFSFSILEIWVFPACPYFVFASMRLEPPLTALDLFVDGETAVFAGFSLFWWLI